MLYMLPRSILRCLDEQASRALWTIFCSLAKKVDITTEASPCLVIAPHADDETLGCGGTIMKLRKAGIPVHVSIVTDGRLSSNSKIISPEELAVMRQSEARKACQILGIDASNISFFAFHDGETEKFLTQITSALREKVQALAPGLILSPYLRDLHPDHQFVAKAVAALQREGIIKCPVYAYPLWFWSVSAFFHLMLPWRLIGLCCVDVSSFLPQKQEAMKAYRSQSTNLTGETSWRILRAGFLVRFFKPYEIFFTQEIK